MSWWWQDDLHGDQSLAEERGDKAHNMLRENTPSGYKNYNPSIHQPKEPEKRASVLREEEPTPPAEE